MNRLAIISAFLGGVKNRYMTYQPDRVLEEKFRMASAVEGIAGLGLFSGTKRSPKTRRRLQPSPISGRKLSTRSIPMMRTDSGVPTLWIGC